MVWDQDRVDTIWAETQQRHIEALVRQNEKQLSYVEALIRQHRGMKRAAVAVAAVGMLL